MRRLGLKVFLLSVADTVLPVGPVWAVNVCNPPTAWVTGGVDRVMCVGDSVTNQVTWVPAASQEGCRIVVTASPPGIVTLTASPGIPWVCTPAPPKALTITAIGPGQAVVTLTLQGWDGTAYVDLADDTVLVTVFKVELQPVAAGNTPDLANGRICINAQAAYKKAKWKVIVKPFGTATVAPLSGGVTVSGGAGLSDGATFWVEGGTTVGDYEISITHDSLATCSATAGEKVFKFIKSISYGLQNITLDLGWQDTGLPGGYSSGGPPSYVPHAYNWDLGTIPTIDFYTISADGTFRSSGADFTVILNATFGVETSPVAGLYSGDVSAEDTCTSTGNMRAEYGVAYYSLKEFVDGNPLLGIGPPGPTSTAAGDVQTTSWSTRKSATTNFTVGAMDGTLTVEAHSCSQRDPFDATTISGVQATQSNQMSDFQIVAP